jgi:hypothetical protein
MNYVVEDEDSGEDEPVHLRTVHQQINHHDSSSDDDERPMPRRVEVVYELPYKSAATIVPATPLPQHPSPTIPATHLAQSYYQPFNNDSEFRLAEFIIENGLSESVSKSLIDLIADPTFDREAISRLSSKKKIVEVIRQDPEYEANVSPSFLMQIELVLQGDQVRGVWRL